MPVVWTKNSSPDKILQLLESSKKVDSSTGNISFEGLSYSECSSALFNLLTFNSEICAFDKRRMIWDGVCNVGKKGVIDARPLTTELGRLQANFIRKGIKKYVLATTINLGNNFSKNRKIINKSTITFTNKFPVSFDKTRKAIFKYANLHLLKGELPNNYLSLRISTHGRSLHESVDRALYNLDLIRGIWNLNLAMQKYSVITTDEVKPLNDIVLGPFHTLHKLDGKEVTDNFWYDRYYNHLHPCKTYNDKNKITSMLKYEKNVRNALKNHPFSNKIQSLLVRFSKALDSTNLESTFLSLWGLLETLTNTGNSSYDVTIKRASFVWTENQLHKQILNHLRYYRNSHVHAGTNDENIQFYCYQLRRYVQALLNFHIGNSGKFENLAKASEFLDMPASHSELKKRQKTLSFAIKFRQ